MERISELILQMTQACRAPVDARALAPVASQALAALFPGSTVLVFERSLRVAVAKVVAAANVLPSWQARTVNLADIPLLARAFEQPQQVFERTAFRREGDHDELVASGLYQTFCAAVPQTSSSRFALLFFAPPAPQETAVRSAAVDAARRLLGALAPSPAAVRTPTLAAIHRAKLEWEHSVDALPEIVGLLDREGRVRRISRAAERWQLGSVRSALGRDPHSVLHPSCNAQDCQLDGLLRSAIGRLNEEPEIEFELRDPALERDLVVNLRASRSRNDGERWRRIVFTVSNVTQLRSAERELKSLNHSLEQRVDERTAELVTANRELRTEVARRRLAEQSLRRSARDLEALSERLMSAQEAERKRIAQDMHDSVGQTLSAIKYSLERAQLLSRRESPLEASVIIEVAIGRVQRLMDEVRVISMNLRPALLDDLGAVSAVRSLCRDWQDVYRAIDVETDIAVEDTDIPPLIVTNVFRAVQESLNNIARHAAAKHVSVSMRLASGVLAVTVRDDGQGFRIPDDGSPIPGTRGLRGLHERAVRTGGRCEVSSAPGQGTTVQLEWPVSAGRAASLENASLN